MLPCYMPRLPDIDFLHRRFVTAMLRFFFAIAIIGFADMPFPLAILRQLSIY